MLAARPGEGMEAWKGQSPQTRPVTCSAARSSRGTVGTVCSVQQTSAMAPWEQEPARNGAPAGRGVRKRGWFSAPLWMPASIPSIAPCAHSSPPQAPHTSGTDALPRRCTQAPSIPSHQEPSGGAGLRRLPSPGCARAPRHSPSCHVDDTSLARTTNRTGAASCAILGSQGAAVGSTPASLGPGDAVSPGEDGWRGAGGGMTAPSVALSLHRCLSPPAWPLCLC